MGAFVVYVVFYKTYACTVNDALGDVNNSLAMGPESLGRKMRRASASDITV